MQNKKVPEQQFALPCKITQQNEQIVISDSFVACYLFVICYLWTMEAELADGFDLFTHHKFVLLCFLSLVKSDIIIMIIIIIITSWG